MFRVVLVVVASLVSVQGIYEGQVDDIANNLAYTAAILRRLNWDNGRFEHSCTGAIISELYILTTASCSGDARVDIVVRVGSSYHNTGGLIHEVANIYQHPKFTPDNDYDIALLKLSKTLKLSHHVATVDLPYQDATLNDGRDVTISGWGYVRFEDSPHNHLTVASTKISNTAACNTNYYYLTGRSLVTDNMICADGTSRPCERDQGAPLVFMGSVYGLFSWHFGCFLASSVPVYTRVSAFRTWIDNYV